jgi:hypothetical protein
MVSAALRQAFIQPDRAAASQTLRHVADQLRPRSTTLAAFIDDSEADVLTHRDFPVQHRTKIHSTNPLERLNKEGKRRADVVGNALPSVIALTELPAELASQNLFDQSLLPDANVVVDGNERVIEIHGERFRVRIDGHLLHSPAALLPLDQLFAVRVAAALRFWRAATARKPGPKP